jgi:hypothetical protein
MFQAIVISGGLIAGLIAYLIGRFSSVQTKTILVTEEGSKMPLGRSTL